jgi:hypothetical protein
MMRTPLFRRELNGTETVIGYAADGTEASMLMDADRENIDWDAGYRWDRPENGKKEPDDGR